VTEAAIYDVVAETLTNADVRAPFTFAIWSVCFGVACSVYFIQS
jgi:hypothetical protein